MANSNLYCTYTVLARNAKYDWKMRLKSMGCLNK